MATATEQINVYDPITDPATGRLTRYGFLLLQSLIQTSITNPTLNLSNVETVAIASRPASSGNSQITERLLSDLQALVAQQRTALSAIDQLRSELETLRAAFFGTRH